MRLRYLAIALALSTAFTSDSLGQSKQPSPSKGKDSQPIESQTQGTKGPPNTDERGTDKIPFAVKIIPAAKTEAEAAAETRERDEKASLDRKLVWFTGLLVLVGFLQFVAIGVQAIFLWFSFRESRKSTDIARDAMIAGERAFVFANGIAPFFAPDSDGNFLWRFRPKLKNSGDTPTRHMTMHSGCIWRESELKPEYVFDYETMRVGTALIPPNTEILGGAAPWPDQPAITPKDILDIQAGKRFLYLLGWVKYSDIFPGTEQHITRFCWLISVTGDPFNPGPKAENIVFGYVHHMRGNCADEECALQELAQPPGHFSPPVALAP